MNKRMELAKRIAERFEKYCELTALVLAGSVTNGVSDELSDIDLYVYSKKEPDLKTREKIASHFADKMELDNRFWETGDEWIDKESGIAVDIMYRSREWIEGQLENVAVKHIASVGYTTCFWHNVRNSSALYDKKGWYLDLQRRYDIPYPKALKRAIVEKNFPILNRHLSSYTHQIETALARGDRISINHRIAAFLASVFDIVFAVNEKLHPGEKRIIQYIRDCSKLPAEFESDINAILDSDKGKGLLNSLSRLELNLTELLVKEGLCKP